MLRQDPYGNLRKNVRIELFQSLGIIGSLSSSYSDRFHNNYVEPMDFS
jgi:hypothetical protein